MQLHLYSRKYGLSIVLIDPQHEDNFLLSHTDGRGNVRPLADVVLEQNQWLVYDKAHTHIDANGGGDSGLHHCALQVGGVVEITDYTDGEVYYLLCVNDRAPARPQLYALPPDGSITIGRERKDICNSCAYVSSLHATLEMDHGSAKLLDNSTNGTYLNRQYTAKSVLQFGDTVDLFGLRLVFLGAYLAVYNYTGGITLSEKLKPHPMGNPRTEALPGRKIDPSDDGIFTFERAPRILQKHVTENISIDAPPSQTEKEQMPLVLTVGSSALMSMSSMMMAATTLQNTLNAGGSLMNAMPTLFMAGSMFVGGLAMPIITRKYTEKQNAAKGKK